jgi:hypothetical protein
MLTLLTFNYLRRRHSRCLRKHPSLLCRLNFPSVIYCINHLIPALHFCLCYKSVILLIRVKNTDDVMGREDSFSGIYGDRQTEGGSEFHGTKYCHGVNIRKEFPNADSRWNERSQLFCGPLRGWPQETPVVSSTFFHTLQPLHPGPILSQYNPEIHLMNPGNKPSCIQDQRSVHLLDRVDIQCITADGIQLKCIFLNSNAFTKSEH